MRITAHYCDLCIKDFYKLKLAIGFYTTENDKSYDVCKKHEKEVKEYGFTVYHFGVIGNSLDLEFIEKG